MTSGRRSRSRSTARSSSTCGAAPPPSTPGRAAWQEDTIINVWSTTKTMAALCCLMLADRGELDLYEPIATYWPEFAAERQGVDVAVRHVLSHTAGLSGWDEPIDARRTCYDRDKVVGAARAPRRRGGSRARASGYHAISQGYLRGRDRPARHGPVARHVLRRRSRRAARRRLPHRHAGPSTTPGSPT